MSATIFPNIPVIDFRRQSMVLEWQPTDGTWSAFDVPPAIVHGVALIRASQPNICLYARAGALHLQVGSAQHELGPEAPLVKWDRELASLGLRRRLTIESPTGDVLLTHAYWNGQGDEFFEWLTSHAVQPEWRAECARRWSDGVEPAVLRELTAAPG